MAIRHTYETQNSENGDNILLRHIDRKSLAAKVLHHARLYVRCPSVCPVPALCLQQLGLLKI